MSDGTSYFYAESVDRVLPSDRTSAARSVSTNHCPNHAWTSLNGFKPLMKSTICFCGLPYAQYLLSSIP